MADAQREAIEIAREQARAELMRAQELAIENAERIRSNQLETERNAHLQSCANTLRDLQLVMHDSADDIEDHRTMLASLLDLVRQVVIPALLSILRNGRSQAERDGMVSQLMHLAERLGTSQRSGVTIEQISGDLAGNVAAGNIKQGKHHEH